MRDMVNRLSATILLPGNEMMGVTNGPLLVPDRNRKSWRKHKQNLGKYMFTSKWKKKKNID